MDLVIGPLNRTDAAWHYNCGEEELFTGAMGARVEKDKIRPIYDGTISKVNPRIQANTEERTTAPALADAAHASVWLHRNHTWIRDKLPRRFWPEWDRPDAEGSEQVEPPAIWDVLKTDVSKAHRRRKIQKKDWKYQVKNWVKNTGSTRQGRMGLHQHNFIGEDRQLAFYAYYTRSFRRLSGP